MQLEFYSVVTRK